MMAMLVLAGTAMAQPAPVVTSVDPVRSAYSESNPIYVVIYGQNLEGLTDITFGGVRSDFVYYADAIQGALALLPPGSGVVDVLITTPSGTSAPSAGSKFTYVGPPVITSVVVEPGSSGVTIYGYNLFGITGVGFSNGAAFLFEPNDQPESTGTSLFAAWSAVNPPTGTVSVSVTAVGGVASGSGQFPVAPTVSALSPASGPPTGGTEVTVTGTDFVEGSTTVDIGGETVPAASVTVNRGTSLSFTTPAQRAGNAAVTVTTPYGTSGAVPGGFTYVSANAPVVTSIGPSRGFYSDSSFLYVTIAGANLATATGVTFGGVSSDFVAWSDVGQFLMALVPAGTGTVDVLVTTPDGTSAPSGSSKFTYFGPPVITSVTVYPASGSVEIQGSNLFSISSVEFDNGEAASIVDRNTDGNSPGTSVRASWSLVNAPGDTVNVTVYAAGGAASGTGYALTVPTLSAISPAGGATTGGTSVTLTGTNFVADSTSVMIGSTVIPAESVTVTSATSLTFVTPADVAGTVGVTVTTPNGTSGVAPGGFTYGAVIATPTLSAISPASGPTAGGTSVTLTGTNLVADSTSVSIGGTVIPAASVVVDSATSLTFTTPAHAAGSVAVTVTTPDGTASPVSGGFTYETPVPIANPVSATVPYGSVDNPITLDLEGGAADSVAVVTEPLHGVAVATGVAISYTPDAGYAGPDEFTYQATNAAGDSAEAVVSLTVSPSTVPIITPAATGTTTVGVAYSQANPASGGTAPYSYALASGALPAGTTIDTATGTVSGTLTTSGAFSYAIKATDSQATPVTVTGSTVTGSIAKGTQTLTFAALADASLSASPLTLGATSNAAGATIVFSSSTTGVCTVSGTSLTLVATGVCTISADAGPTTNYIAATTVTRSFNVTPAALVITPAASGTTKVGVAYSQANPATGGTGPYSYALASGSLPAGTTLDVGTGTVSGTPTAVGAFSYAIMVTDSQGTPVTVTSSVVSGTISAPTISITPTSPPNPTAGVAYSQAFTASGGTASYAYAVTAGALPTGLTLSPTGTLSGTPTAGGSFSFTVTATDSSTGAGPYTCARAYTLTVAAAVVAVSPATLPNGSAGTAYSQTVTASGGTGPYAFALSAGALPPGWTLSPSGMLSGTATESNSFSFTIRATDSSTGSGPYSGTRAYTVDVVSPTFTLTPPTLAATVGQAYSGSFAAGGGTAPYTYAVFAGTVPTGMTFASNGTLSGTPTAGGTFNFSVVARDTTAGGGAPYGVAGNFNFVVSAPTLALAPATLPDGTAGTAYSATISASGGVSPYTYTVTAGALPAGLTLDAATGALSGTPTTSGTANFTVTATDSSTGSGAPFSASRAYALTIAGAAPTVAASSASVPYDTATAIDLSALITGVHSSLAIGTAPAHGTTSIAGDVITYTPTAGYSGTDSFTWTATGPGGTSNVATLSLTVETPAAPTGAATSASVPYDTATAIDLTASITGVHSSLAIETAPAHGTTSIAGDVITYTPTAGYYGADSFTWTATGPGGTSSAATVSLTVAVPAAPTVADTAGVAAAFNSTGTAIELSALITGVHSSIAVATVPAHGTVSVAGDVASYTPAAGYYGPDSFTWTATGPGGTSSAATVSLTVATPAAPTVAATSASVAYNTAAAVDLSAIITGVHTSVAVASAPSHGATTLSGDTVTYTPTSGYSGPDSFTWTATGPGGTSAQATVSITVGPPPAPTVSDVAGVAISYGSTGTAIDLAGALAGVFSDVTVASPPIHGSATVNGAVITYAPASGYVGPDSFTVIATGPGGASAPATVSLMVAAPPPPVIDVPTGPVVVPPSMGGSVSVNLGTLREGVIDGFRVTVGGEHGTVELVEAGQAVAAADGRSAAPGAGTNVQLVYTPAANFMGTDTVTVLAFGPGGDSAPVTFTFQVAGRAPDLTASTPAGVSVTLMPTSTLVGGPFSAVRITRAPGFGTATVNGLDILFTPGPANGGATSLDYVIDLPFGTSAAGRIDLTSTLVPAAQILTTDTLQGAPVTVRISNAAGGPFTDAAVVGIDTAGAGTAIVTGAGANWDLTFTPAAAFSGQVVVTFSLTNAYGTTNGSLAVTVEARPDPSGNAEVRGVATAPVASARRFADAQLNNFQRRLQTLHDGANRSSNGLTLNLGSGGSADMDKDPRQALRRQLGVRDPVDPGAMDDRSREMLGLDFRAGRDVGPEAVDAATGSLASPPATGGRGGGQTIGFWTAGSVDWGRQDSTGQRDYRFTTQGVTAGLDMRVGDTLIVGGGVGYGEDRTRIGDNDSVSDGKAWTGALYAGWRPAEAVYVDGVFGFADLDFEIRRWVDGLAGQSDGYATADRSGDVIFASAAFGRVTRGRGAITDVYARVDAREITLDGFTETGGGLGGLVWDKIDQGSLSANLGAEWRWAVDTRRHGLISPSARLEWSHEFEDVGAQGVRYADWAASPTYLVPLDAWSRDMIKVDLGAEWSLTERLMLDLGFRSVFGDAGTSHGGDIRVRFEW